jgi:N-acetylglucosaminyl-diphospho-decaprenol L-rhamnosyltransferase
MAFQPPWVRIVIVNYNAGALLQACIDALAIQTDPAFEAVIVDNASSSPAITELRLPDPRFKIRRAGGNIGFAAGSNLGAEGSSCPWLAMLNPDTAPRPDWLAELRAATLRHPSAMMFGSTQLDAKDPRIVDGFGDVLSALGTAWRSGSGLPVSELPTEDREVFSPCAAAALYSRRTFEEVGGFDESFFCYLEDVDLGFRLRLRGGRCVQVRRAEVVHVGAATTGRFSNFSVFHSYRNRIWLFVKGLPWPLLPPILMLQGASIAVALARRQAKPYRRAALQGVWAGLKGVSGAMAKRKEVQRQRVVTSLDTARMMAWHPLRRRSTSSDEKHRGDG